MDGSNFMVSFRNAKRVGTSIIAITTQEPAELMVQIDTLHDVPSISWDLVRGLVGRNRKGINVLDKCLGGKGSKVTQPFEALQEAENFPDNCLLYMIHANRYLSNEAVMQAVWNLRDVFKVNGRTLVLLGPSFEIPPELQPNILLLHEPLPDTEELEKIVLQTYAGGGVEPPSSEMLEASVHALRGLSSYAVEQSAALSLRKAGLDMNELWSRKKEQIDTTKGLSVERGRATFDDLRGLQQIVKFSRMLMTGSQPPVLQVRVEEIDKALAASASDNTGVTQDAVMMLLDTMESQGYDGIIAEGPPGTGKTLYSEALANTYGCLSLRLDLGGMKSKELGSSEQAIRQAIQVINSLAGPGGAFFVATCNRLDGIRPELIRRFTMGIWFWDLPTEEERQAIWQLNIKKYGLPYTLDDVPEDEDWSGSDIRNVCKIAWKIRTDLHQAATFISPVGKTDPEGIDRLRNQAHGRYLSASYEGVYQHPNRLTSAIRRIDTSNGG